MDENELKQTNKKLTRFFLFGLLILLFIQIAVTALLLVNDNLSLEIIDPHSDLEFYYVHDRWSNVIYKHDEFIRYSSDSISKSIIYPSVGGGDEDRMDGIEKELIELQEQKDSISDKLRALNIDKLNILKDSSKTDIFFSDLAKDYLNFFNSIYYIDPLYGGADSYANQGTAMENIIRNFPNTVKQKWPAYIKPDIDKFRKSLMIETAIVVFILLSLLVLLRLKCTDRWRK